MRPVLDSKQIEPADKGFSDNGFVFVPQSKIAVLLLSGFLTPLRSNPTASSNTAHLGLARREIRGEVSIWASANRLAARDLMAFTVPAPGTIGSRAYWLSDTITFGEML